MSFCTQCSKETCADCPIANEPAWDELQEAQASGRIGVIEGYPSCPECHRRLHLRSMPDAGESRWYCDAVPLGCGTQWETADLIQALNDNRL